MRGLRELKIVTVVGARPQFVKAASVRKAVDAFNAGLFSSGGRARIPIREVLVHTGQHYDELMDKVFFQELQLPRPDYHLGVGSGSHGKQTGMMLERIESVLEKEKPAIVMVYGDTNSTLAGALAAAKPGIPLAHVEAGLRSRNRAAPEEINRILTDHVSTLLLCPTPHAVRTLAGEGIRDGKERVVKNVGDVMYDSVVAYSAVAEKHSTILRDLGLISGERGRPGNSQRPDYYLATLHRAENTDEPRRLKSILRALDEIATKTPVVLPLHPRTKKAMEIQSVLSRRRRVRLINPVSYVDMLKLERNARAILTDSGGVQKEAHWFGVPCLVLRDETEWVETLRGGRNVLVGADQRRIMKGIRGLNDKPPKKPLLGTRRRESASQKVVSILAAYVLSKP